MERRMHLLKQRQRLILGFLLDKDVPVITKYIAEQLNVSPRTVRYDLDDLDYWMQSKNLVLKKVPKKGIWIPDKEAVKAVLAKIDSVEEVKAYRILSKEERRRELLALLFAADDRVSIGTLSEAVGVSKSTCYADMERVGSWLDHRCAKLDTKPHSGYRIEATEEGWRRILIEYLEEIADNQQLMNMVTLNKQEKKDARIDFLRNPEYHDMFSEVDLNRMVVFVEVLEQRLQIRLLDSAYAALMIHIAIAVKRIREGELIEMPEEQLTELRMFDTYDIVDEVLSTMNFLRFDHVPEAEVGYITAHIVAARMRSRKESYRSLQFKSDGLTGRDRELYQGILEIITEHATVHNAGEMKKELKDLIMGIKKAD